ncbi:DinB family protein [Pelagicoccus mobilis]|uniref:DinB family protein n=1 Tax=Pelagicoccus mobilis TaxID=415221 RepID=A0A934S3A0_9BACT|nr:DinB family protein [Pelagicoccus mobilis]MBK1878253.1 DinB family protein [Pelagicoccus mobilis]
MKKSIALITAVFAFFAQGLLAGHHEKGENLFLQTISGKLDFANGRLLELADEFTEEGYAWRPSEGIRSVKDAVLHVAAGNYFLASKLGAELPEGIVPFQLEKTIETKEEAIATLKASYDFAREVMVNLSEEELQEKIDFFGNEVNKMWIVLQWSDHTNEHLGQLIAYARSSGVVPPWSKP